MTAVEKEIALEADRPIIDPHHHLWDVRGREPHEPASQYSYDNVLRRTPRYLAEDLLADLNSGHDIRATVHLECGSMYRRLGLSEMAPIGETEFVNGVAAMGASGVYGNCQLCAGIVGYADLSLGDRVAPVLEAHMRASKWRFRGIRQSAAHDADPEVIKSSPRTRAGLYRNAQFRAGFRRLASLNLTFDAWLLEPQLPDLIDLARAFPDTMICLDHAGTPLGIGSYGGRREERFSIWRTNIETLAKCPNVFVKLGGLGMPYCAFPSFMTQPAPSSVQLAEEWRPYIEVCIEAFSPGRSMFESNFPVDALTCSYATLWNAFKRLAEPYTDTERHDLFFATAARFYRIQVDH